MKARNIRSEMRSGYTQCGDGLWRKRVDYQPNVHEVLVRDDAGCLKVDRVSNWPHNEPAPFAVRHTGGKILFCNN